MLQFWLESVHYPQVGQLQRWLRRHRAALIGCLVALVAIGVPGITEAAVMSPYRLLPGDQITLTLPLNPELNASGPIGPDGQFSVPLLGRVALAGLSLDEAERLVAYNLRLQNLVANAKANIAVNQYEGAVYVGGEVKTPGTVRLTRGLNPLQAIISSGGLLDTAKSKEIAIIRPSPSGSAAITKVDLRSYIHSGSASAALLLDAGDIVFVPKSNIAEVDLWIDQHVNKIVPSALNFNANVGAGAAFIR